MLIDIRKNSKEPREYFQGSWDAVQMELAQDPWSPTGIFEVLGVFFELRTGLTGCFLSWPTA
jgi:hypothetical protein